MVTAFAILAMFLIFLLCLLLTLSPSLFRFTTWPLGYWGRCDPQPLHNRFYPFFVPTWPTLCPFHMLGATYLVLQLCGGTSLSIGLTSAINLSYLLAGYWCSMISLPYPNLSISGTTDKNMMFLGRCPNVFFAWDWSVSCADSVLIQQWST